MCTGVRGSCAQVAGRTNDSAGDGTTTASVLAREMIQFGLQVRAASHIPSCPTPCKSARACSALHTPLSAFCCLCMCRGVQVVTAGANPITVKKGIDKTCDFLVGKLKENAKPVKGREDIKVRRDTVTLL